MYIIAEVNQFSAACVMCILGRLRKCLSSGHIEQRVELAPGCCGRFHADADAQRQACVRSSLYRLFPFIIITVAMLFLLLCLAFRHF